MARIRTIKPEFFTSEDIVSLSPMARLLYIAIWCEADREGRLVWKPKTFKMRYFPADDCNIQALCDEITEAGLVKLYGEGYAYIPAFHAHQHINPRETASQLPEPEKDTRKGARKPRGIDASLTREPRDSDVQGGREGKGKERKDISGGDEKSPFDQFWECWPKNDRKQDKAKCEAKWSKDGLDEVLAEILADVAAKKLTPKWRDGYVEAPMVYLNNRRWEDGTATASMPELKFGSDEYFEFHRSQTWWAEAGFDSVWEAVSSRCNHKNFSEFRNGQRLEAA